MREGVAETHGHLEVLTARTWSRQKLATGHSHMQKKKKKTRGSSSGTQRETFSVCSQTQSDL